MSKLFLRMRLLAATLGLGAGSAQAFIMIDTAGAREVISPASFAEEPLKEGEAYASRSLKLSSKDKSLTGFWLWHRRTNANQPLVGARTRTMGIDLKISEPDGLEQFVKFERTPNWEVGFLANWTFHPAPLSPGAGADGLAVWQSFTLQAGYQQQSVEYMPLTGNPAFQAKRARDGSGFASATAGFYVNGVPGVGQLSFVLNAEARHGSNYSDLPKVTIDSLTILLPAEANGGTRLSQTKSKTLRRGDLQEDTLYPLTAAMVFTLPANWPLSLLGEPGKRDSGQFYLAPYCRLTPSADSGTARAYGLNLAFRSKTYGKDSPRGKITIPLSVFVERGRGSTDRNWATVSGVSTVFSWGP